MHLPFCQKSVCQVFSCFRNPPNSESDMDYRIFKFNVRMWSHGGWVHRQRVSKTFLTQKNVHIFLQLLTLTGFKSQVFGSRVRHSTNWTTRHPSQPIILCIHLLSWYSRSGYSRFAGNLWPQVILASPVSQPCSVRHSRTRKEPAALCIAPSTETDRHICAYTVRHRDLS